MPVQYTFKIIAIWERYFERGTLPDYGAIAAAGEEVRSHCPVGAQLCTAHA
jgi:hypothetical protein